MRTIALAATLACGFAGGAQADMPCRAVGLLANSAARYRLYNHFSYDRTMGVELNTWPGARAHAEEFSYIVNIIYEHDWTPEYARHRLYQRCILGLDLD